MSSDVSPDSRGSDAPPAVEPYIPASTNLAEITIKAVILGIVLSVLLAGANAYLGLKAGMTVSASIPAAVISMAVLRMFRKSNILENNIVQTAASAGESLAAGVIFTVPALVLLGAWTEFDYWKTTMIAAMGGLLGVVFTIPLRRALIVQSSLKFPEGVATAEVLKVGDTGGGGVKKIVIGAAIGAFMKFGETGIRLWKGAVEGGAQVGNSVAYVGTNTGPALLAVGYIVGINIAVLVFLGGAINWYAAIPIFANSQDWPTHTEQPHVYRVDFAVTPDDMTEEAQALAATFNAAQLDQVSAETDALASSSTLFDGFAEGQEPNTYFIEFVGHLDQLDADSRTRAEQFNKNQLQAIELEQTSKWEPQWNEFPIEPQLIADDLSDEDRAAAESNNEMIGEPIDAGEWASRIWSKRTRYIGVGAMVVGGLWALLRLWGNLVRGLKSSMGASRSLPGGEVKRTDRDTPMKLVAIVLIVSIVPLYFIFNSVTDNAGIAAVMAVVMLVAAFLFAAVASYMAGLVGSSNNPISGMTIATLLTAALLLLALGMDDATGPVAAIIIGAVVACAAAIGGDNMQDLKAGQLVGATPYKQQIMQVVGVIAAALIMAPVLTALLKAYGIGPITVEGQEALQAPQATLMQSVASGVFGEGLPWNLVYIGMVVAAIVIVIDLVLEAKRTSFRAPVLAVAVGIYLPLELSVPILLGGLISLAADRFHMRKITNEADGEPKARLKAAKVSGERNGLLFAAGLITGEAMLGILLAMPLAAWQGDNKIANWFADVTGITEALFWPGLVLLGLVMALLYRTATRDR